MISHPNFLSAVSCPRGVARDLAADTLRVASFVSAVGEPSRAAAANRRRKGTLRASPRREERGEDVRRSSRTSTTGFPITLFRGEGVLEYDGAASLRRAARRGALVPHCHSGPGLAPINLLQESGPGGGQHCRSPGQFHCTDSRECMWRKTVDPVLQDVDDAGESKTREGARIWLGLAVWQRETVAA